jgi:hypothetical protein
MVSMSTARTYSVTVEVANETLTLSGLTRADAWECVKAAKTHPGAEFVCVAEGCTYLGKRVYDAVRLTDGTWFASVTSTFDRDTRARDCSTLVSLIRAEEYEAVVRWTCYSPRLCRESEYAWGQAKTARYGESGIARGRLKADGSPDPEKCRDVPQVFRRMAEARDALRRLVGIKEIEAAE